MNSELQTEQSSSSTPSTKKVWNAPGIQVLNLREAQTKGKIGTRDTFNFRSH